MPALETLTMLVDNCPPKESLHLVAALSTSLSTLVKKVRNTSVSLSSEMLLTVVLAQLNDSISAVEELLNLPLEGGSQASALDMDALHMDLNAQEAHTKQSALRPDTLIGVRSPQIHALGRTLLFRPLTRGLVHTW